MRIDPVVTASYVITLAAPVAVYASLRLVRAGRHHEHRRVQAVMLLVAWLAVVAIELRIRFAGGSGSFVAQVAEPARVWAGRLLAIHIAGAVITYVVWTALVVVSWRRFGERLPGSFSRGHRRAGVFVFGGLCFTAASASAIYALVFVM